MRHRGRSRRHVASNGSRQFDYAPRRFEPTLCVQYWRLVVSQLRVSQLPTSVSIMAQWNKQTHGMCGTKVADGVRVHHRQSARQTHSLPAGNSEPAARAPIPGSLNRRGLQFATRPTMAQAMSGDKNLEIARSASDDWTPPRWHGRHVGRYATSFPDWPHGPKVCLCLPRRYSDQSPPLTPPDTIR